MVATILMIIMVTTGKYILVLPEVCLISPGILPIHENAFGNSSQITPIITRKMPIPINIFAI